MKFFLKIILSKTQLKKLIIKNSNTKGVFHVPSEKLKEKNIKENILEQLKEIIRDAIREATYEYKLTLTIEEAARYTGIGRDKILELAHNPESGFPSFKVGTKFLINRELLKEWLKKVAEERKVL